MTGRRAALLAALLGLLPGVATACPVCFGDDPGPMTDGARAAAFVLLGLSGAMLTTIGAVAWSIYRRTRR